MVQAKILQAAIIKEILDYLGYPESTWRRRLAEQLFQLPAMRFAKIVSGFDQKISESGFGEASRWLLPQFLNGFQTTGIENIPKSGPLIVAANHPGTFDTFMIGACLPRDDLKIIARDMPVLHQLEFTNRYMIYSTRNAHVKMTAARAAIKHLRSDGALLVFSTGNMGPDPVCMSGAEQGIENWSASLELLLRSQPKARLQAVISSGLLDQRFFRNPLARMQKDEHWAQIVAEILQMAYQLLFRQKLKSNPKITFGYPFSLEELKTNSNNIIMEGVIEAGKKCLQWHLDENQHSRAS